MTTNWSPPERRLGSLYEQTKGMRTKEVAAHMRKVIRQTATDGLLPTDWTYSVRYRTASMMTAIDVTVAIPDELHDLWVRYETENRYRIDTFPDLLVDEWAPLAGVLAAKTLLESIHRAYNYDGSDSMTDYFDVRYYGTVEFIGQGWYDRFYKTTKKKG